MTYITKPNIPDSKPDVTWNDEARGDVRKYLEGCYDYLRSKGVDFEEYDFDDDEYDGGEKWRVADHISSIEREIENVDEEKVGAARIEDLKNRIDHNEQFTGTVAKKMCKLNAEIIKIKKEMCTQNNLDIANGRIKSLAHILEQHSYDIAKLRKEND